MKLFYINPPSPFQMFRLVGLACLLGLALLPRTLPALDVWVTLEPQAYIVEQIGGDEVTVHVLVPPGRSPATYAPTPSEVGALTRSDLLFGIGVPAERRLLERLGGALRRVHVIESGSWRLPLHDHGPEAKPGDGGPDHGDAHDHHACGGGGSLANDPHLWMDPYQMIAFSESVTEELAAAKPEASSAFAARGARLRKQLEQIDAEIRERLSPHIGRSFFINHASLGHFAARYGLEQRTLEQVGSQASTRRIARMVDEARDAGAGAILAQVQFPRSTADVLAESLGLPVLTVDPLRRDFPENLRAVTKTLQQAFESARASGDL
ncbi:MAG: metal ABC transporter solute-binding protein, Zn/Mn family [Opitutales bacterium]